MAEQRVPPPTGDTVTVTLEVNGASHVRQVPARRSLADFLRDDLGLTGTHLGCEHGVCGACTVDLDGVTARSCLTLAAQADGSRVTTIEGLADPDGPLHPVQQAFAACHGLQCGFCTPGFVMAVREHLAEVRGPDDADIRARLSGNLCRCTGYQGIVAAVRSADERWDRGATDLASAIPRQEEPRSGRTR